MHLASAAARDCMERAAYSDVLYPGSMLLGILPELDCKI